MTRHQARLSCVHTLDSTGSSEKFRLGLVPPISPTYVLIRAVASRKASGGVSCIPFRQRPTTEDHSIVPETLNLTTFIIKVL